MSIWLRPATSELHCHSAFSLLDGASTPAELRVFVDYTHGAQWYVHGWRD